MALPPPGNDDDFEAFRREQARRQRRLSADETPADAARREVQEEDEREAEDLQMRREILDFVRETTKHAAEVLGDMEEEHSEEVSRKVESEMEEFLETTTEETQELLGLLKERYGGEGPSGEPPKPQLDLSSTPAPVEPAPAAPALHFDADVVGDLSDEAGDLLAGALVGESVDSSIDVDAQLTDPLEVDAFEDLAELRSMTEVPTVYGRLLEDPATAKRTLAVLVQAGLLTREEAREVFVELEGRKSC